MIGYRWSLQQEFKTWHSSFMSAFLSWWSRMRQRILGGHRLHCSNFRCRTSRTPHCSCGHQKDSVQATAGCPWVRGTQQCVPRGELLLTGQIICGASQARPTAVGMRGCDIEFETGTGMLNEAFLCLFVDWEKLIRSCVCFVCFFLVFFFSFLSLRCLHTHKMLVLRWHG